MAFQPVDVGQQPVRGASPKVRSSTRAGMPRARRAAAAVIWFAGRQATRRGECEVRTPVIAYRRRAVKVRRDAQAEDAIQRLQADAWRGESSSACTPRRGIGIAPFPRPPASASGSSATLLPGRGGMSVHAPAVWDRLFYRHAAPERTSGDRGVDIAGWDAMGKTRAGRCTTFGAAARHDAAALMAQARSPRRRRRCWRRAARPRDGLPRQDPHGLAADHAGRGSAADMSLPRVPDFLPGHCTLSFDCNWGTRHTAIPPGRDLQNWGPSLRGAAAAVNLPGTGRWPMRCRSRCRAASWSDPLALPRPDPAGQPDIRTRHPQPARRPDGVRRIFDLSGAHNKPMPQARRSASSLPACTCSRRASATRSRTSSRTKSCPTATWSAPGAHHEPCCPWDRAIPQRRPASA